ncbi:MAG TPA: YciI family protein [Candidatus Elarobacter sp.]|jgi:uncharacterized protein YciI
MTHATVIYRRGGRWDAAAPFREQSGIGAHVGFLRERSADGSLLCGGPFTDDSGGVAIYRCDDLPALTALVGSDPCVVDGLLEAEIHPTMLPFMPGAHG